MSKKELSKTEIEAAVKKTFEEYKVDKLYATSDGNVFLSENFAKLHAGKDGKVFPFDRPMPEYLDGKATDSKSDSKTGKAEDVIKAITEAKTREELIPYETDVRKTVKAAFDKRVTELNAGTEMEGSVITQELLDANPDLVEQGLKIGDLFNFPKNENQ